MVLSVDRIQGLSGGIALKAPCRTATTANLPVRAELLEVGGVTLAAGDRVLVKDQTDPTENGIFVADEGNWARAKDFNGPNDILSGTWVTVSSGTYEDYIFGVRFTGDFNPGVTELTFTGELAIGIVPTIEAAALSTAADAAATAADRIAVAADAASAEADALAAAASASDAQDAETAAEAAAALIDGWEWKGEWVTATAYEVNNLVRRGSSSYIALTDHTSDDFDTDLGAGDWDLLVFAPSGAGTGDLISTNNLSDVASASASRANLGLGNVDNTSDADKPVSTATQAALDAKQATLVSGTNIKTVNSTSLLGSGDVVISGDIPDFAAGTETALPILTSEVISETADSYEAQPSDVYSLRKLAYQGTPSTQSFSVMVLRAGTLRVSLEHRRATVDSGTSEVRVRKGGSTLASWTNSTTTWTERTTDVAVVAGDIVTVQHRVTSFKLGGRASEIRNIYILVDDPTAVAI